MQARFTPAGWYICDWCANLRVSTGIPSGFLFCCLSLYWQISHESLLLSYYENNSSLRFCLLFFFFKKIGHLCCPLTFLFWIAGKQLCCEHGRTFATLLLFYCKAGNSQWLSNLWNCRSILFGLGTSIARKCFGLNQENKGLIFSL